MAISKAKAKTYNPEQIWLFVQTTDLKTKFTYTTILNLKVFTENRKLPGTKDVVLRVATNKTKLKKYVRSYYHHKEKESQNV